MWLNSIVLISEASFLLFSGEMNKAPCLYESNIRDMYRGDGKKHEQRGALFSSWSNLAGNKKVLDCIMNDSSAFLLPSRLEKKCNTAENVDATLPTFLFIPTVHYG